MSEKARTYTRLILRCVEATDSMIDIQHLLELEFRRLDDLGTRYPELRKQVDTALENRRAYFAQEPL